MIISIIAAVAKNNVIGYKNKIPWRLPADLKYFKKTTLGHHVIMGQNTFESIKTPLVGRTNIILSFNRKFRAKGCITVFSLEEALRIASFAKDNEAFIIGGASVYKQAIDIADKLYITCIDEKFKGDAFFPEIDKNKWKKKSVKKHKIDSKNPYPYSFIVFKKKRG